MEPECSVQGDPLVQRQYLHFAFMAQNESKREEERLLSCFTEVHCKTLYPLLVLVFGPFTDSMLVSQGALLAECQNTVENVLGYIK